MIKSCIFIYLLAFHCVFPSMEPELFWEMHHFSYWYWRQFLMGNIFIYGGLYSILSYLFVAEIRKDEYSRVVVSASIFLPCCRCLPLLSPSFIFAVEIEAILVGLLSYLFVHLINLDMFRFPFVSIGNWKQQKSNNLYFCNYRNLQTLFSCTKKDLIYFWIAYVSTVTEVEYTSDGTVTTSFIPCTHFKPYVVK